MGPIQGKREDRDKVSDAKELREKAKLIDKKIFHENARWELGASRMDAREWQKLLDAQEEAWDRAEVCKTSLGWCHASCP